MYCNEDLFKASEYAKMEPNTMGVYRDYLIYHSVKKLDTPVMLTKPMLGDDIIQLLETKCDYTPMATESGYADVVVHLRQAYLHP